ncbi:MAG: DUF6515 family protein [Synechococcus sp.]
MTRGDRASSRLSNRPDVQNSLRNRESNISRSPDNRNINIDNSRNVNIGDIDVNRGGGWYGGGWYGRGYYTPPGWGLVGFATGLAIGASLSSPPPYYSTVYVGTTRYIYSDGVYLLPQNDTYVVVEPPPTAVVTYLPEGCEAFVIEDFQFFDCSGVYYEPFSQDGAIVYRVVEFQSE